MTDQDLEKIHKMMAKMLAHNRQEILEDMKQFTRAEISQSETRLEQKISDSVNGLETSLTARMDDGFAGVGEAIDAIHQLHDEHDKAIKQNTKRLDDHNRQLQRLKQKIA